MEPEEVLEEQVEQQCHIGKHTWNESVQHYHVNHQQHEGYDERDDTLFDGLCTK